MSSLLGMCVNVVVHVVCDDRYDDLIHESCDDRSDELFCAVTNRYITNEFLTPATAPKAPSKSQFETKRIQVCVRRSLIELIITILVFRTRGKRQLFSNGNCHKADGGKNVKNFPAYSTQNCNFPQ